MPITETLAMLITANGAEALTVIDDLQAKLVKLDAKSAESGKALGAAVTVGAVVAGAALVDMLAKGTKALEQQQVVDAQTQATLASTGDAANVTAGHIATLAENVSNYSGKSIDAVKQTENMLLQFTNIKNVGPNKIFDETTKAALDMAQALGIDGVTAATMLGKALQDPAAGLSRLSREGVIFTAQEKEQIKTLEAHGQSVEAQQLILDRVMQKFGGSAANFGKTTQGEFDKVGNAFVELEKTLAKPILDPLAKGLGGLAKAIETVNNDAPGLIQVAAGIGLITAGWVLAEKTISVYQDLHNGVIATAIRNAGGIEAEGAATAVAGTEAEIAAGQLGLFATAEAAAGDAGYAAVPGITAAGDAAALAGTQVAGVLKLLGGFAGALIPLTGATLFDKAQPTTSTVTGDPALTKQLQDFEKTQKIKLLGGTKLSPAEARAFMASGGATFGNGAGSSSGLLNTEPGYGTPASDIFEQAGTGGQFGTVDMPGAPRLYDANGHFIGGNDPYYQQPDTPNAPKGKGAGGGGGALATLNAQDTLAALFGLTPDGIAAALNQGVVTGKSSLNDLMTQAGSLLTGTARSIVSNLSSILSAAVSFGQAAQKSLQFSLTGAPQMGTATDVTVGPNGQLTSRVESPVLGQLQQTLATDQRFVADIGKLKKMGLNRDLLGQLISSGPSQIASADALANSSPSDISAINSTDNSVNLLAQQYGQAVTQTQYLAQLVALTQQLIAALPGSITKTSLVQTNQAAATALLRARTVTTGARR